MCNIKSIFNCTFYEITGGHELSRNTELANGGERVC